MLTPATEMSQGARPTGLAKPVRLKRTAEKCARETGMGNPVQRVWKKRRVLSVLAHRETGRLVEGHGLLGCSSHLKDK